MSQGQVILFVPMQAHGHMNPCIGVAEQLQERGHQIHFVVDQKFQGKLKHRGFKEELCVAEETQDGEDPTEKQMKVMIEHGIFKKATPLDKTKMIFSMNWADKMRPNDPLIKEIIERVKPDLIIVDFFLTPAIIKSKIPWINLFPAHPLLGLEDERVPPGGSGLPANDSSGWAEFRMEIEKVRASHNHFEKWFEEEGCGPLPKSKWIESPLLNFYAYPKELDYDDLRPISKNWTRFDSFIRMKEEEFEMPEQLKNKPGKLIYFSMGSMGSSDVELMKRLIDILAKSPHRFIVSKGVFGDTYDLPDNCWGQKMVPQTKILPLIDLAVIHGGNNTVCEAFYFGKPLILMPIFGDQFDSAQRVDEKGFGIRLDPFTCTEEQLLGAIERLVNDESLKKQMQQISKRIQESVGRGEVADAIENLMKSL